MSDISSAMMLGYIFYAISLAFGIVLLFSVSRIGSVVGYLCAGIISGKYFLNIISESAIIDVASDFGIILLLFSIGLELSIEKLKSIELRIFALGLLQVSISGVVFYIILRLLNINETSALILAGSIAMSSTAVVSKCTNQKSSKSGRIACIVLVCQDMIVPLLLILVKSLSGNRGDAIKELGISILKTATFMPLALIVGAFIIRHALNYIYKLHQKDLFTGAILVLVVGSAYLTHHIGLSESLGPFVSGLLVAETYFSSAVHKEIMPWESIFMGTFFVSIGMSINPSVLQSQIGIILVYSIGILLIKFIIMYVLCKVYKLQNKIAIKISVLLSQAGEFGIVLMKFAVDLNVIDANLAQIATLSIIVTMAVTPSLSKLPNLIFRDKNIQDSQIQADEMSEIKNHIVILGMSTIGKTISKVLESNGIQYVVGESRKNLVMAGIKSDIPIYQGDFTKLKFLIALGIERASTLIITTCNVVTISSIMRLINKHFANVNVIIRIKNASKIKKMPISANCTVIPDHSEAGIQLACAALEIDGMDLEDITEIKYKTRENNYLLLNDIDKVD